MDHVVKVCVALGLMLHAASASAQAPASDAERLFHEGTAALMEGRLPEAKTALARSLELHPHPGAAFNLMMTLADLNELLAASRLCRRLLGGDFGSLGERRVQVERICEGVWENVPVLEIVATGADELQLHVDGELDATIGPEEPVTRQLDPGRHVVRLDAPGHRSDERAVDLRRRDRVRIELRAVSTGEVKRRRVALALTIAGAILAAGAAVTAALVVANRPPDQPVDDVVQTLVRF